MNRIALVRHGRSAHLHRGWIDARGFRAWREAYEAAGIREDERPPADLAALAAGADVVLSSDAPRAMSSARLLAAGRDVVVSPLLRELTLEGPRLGPLRLPLTAWAIAVGGRNLLSGRLDPRSADPPYHGAVAARSPIVPPSVAAAGHAGWVRVCHWVGAASVMTLAVTGFVILMAHPRLYWGEVGNDLTPALLELPISRNHRHGGFDAPTPLTTTANGPVSANRTYEIFNQNGWGRSLHFLAAWCLVVPGLAYLVASVATGHARAHLWPRAGELTATHVRQEVADHLRLRIRPPSGGPQYGLLQKCAYSLVVFVAAPLIVLTGLAMAPAVTAALPWLGAAFGGYQSARTIHFAAFVALVIFALAHVTMVVRSGFRRQMRAMTVGE